MRSNTTFSLMPGSKSLEVEYHKEKCLCLLPCANLSNLGFKAFNLRLFNLTENLHKAIYLLCLPKKISICIRSILWLFQILLVPTLLPADILGIISLQALTSLVKIHLTVPCPGQWPIFLLSYSRIQRLPGNVGS